MGGACSFAAVSVAHKPLCEFKRSRKGLFAPSTWHLAFAWVLKLLPAER